MRQDFLDAVGTGKIKGFEVRHLPQTGVNVLMVDNVGTLVVSMGPREIHKVNSAHFCEKLRDWFTAKGWHWHLEPSGIEVWKLGDESLKSDERFRDGSQLDWHVQAAMHILANEDKP
jgi:hypothetical protein